MKIEAVVVCKDYSDFLEQTLPDNLQQVDRLVVVTHPNDRRTIDLCSRFSVECVQTTCMHTQGDEFNKGRAINLGLGHLRGLEWMLHMDADILLPHGFRNMLARTHLDPKNIYGADRVNVVGYDNWMAHKHKTVPHYSHRYFVEPPKEFNLGARIIHSEHGYTPIGYFQFWHRSANRKYPIHQGNAEHTDLLFACQWARENRVLLPEIFVYHLESESSQMGANWKGRKTKWFGPHENHSIHHHHCHKPPYRPKDEK
jgi:hypothetical protein